MAGEMGSGVKSAVLWPILSTPDDQQISLEEASVDVDGRALRRTDSQPLRSVVKVAVAVLGAGIGVFAYTYWQRMHQEAGISMSQHVEEHMGLHEDDIGAHLTVRQRLQQWKPECDPANKLVTELRERNWPHPASGIKGKIEDVLYLNRELAVDTRREFKSYIDPLLNSNVEEAPDLKFERIVIKPTTEVDAPRTAGFPAASHVLALQRAYEIFLKHPDHGPILIMGDNEHANQHFERGWKFMRHLVPHDFDIVRVEDFMTPQEACGYAFNAMLALSVYSKEAHNQQDRGCGAYIVSRSGVKKLLSRLKISLAAQADLPCDEMLGYKTPRLEDTNQVPELHSFSVFRDGLVSEEKPHPRKR
eukprot:TRINITY_DN24584_c0_g1_i1.p1 TRINITY_DN24584_c0_g1~~TRINITY_DN24584_c0_g1_i1.p1  ORF type:complete len:386 (+),score=52.95 TRINITY_DN24584_c0_g1_i1:78-1160(+)